MFDEASEEAGALASEAAVRTCWTQWASLGSVATSRDAPDQATIVDPEALVLLSLSVRRLELRLGEQVAWWALEGSHLTSVQRFRTLARHFPPEVGQEGLARFAGLATDSGDRRWKRYASDTASDGVRGDRPRPTPDLLAPAALWPRIRAGFGVGAKADVLVFLLGLRGASASVPQISAATHYTQTAIRRAAADMSAARLLRETEWRPLEYLAPVDPWAELLELTSEAGGSVHAMPEVRTPRWRYWGDVFAFLAWVADWSLRARSTQGRGVHTMASRARDIVKRHSRAFDQAGVPAPPIERFRGREAVLGLLETTRALVHWMGTGP